MSSHAEGNPWAPATDADRSREQAALTADAVNAILEQIGNEFHDSGYRVVAETDGEGWGYLSLTAGELAEGVEDYPARTKPWMMLEEIADSLGRLRRAVLLAAEEQEQKSGGKK